MKKPTLIEEINIGSPRRTKTIPPTTENIVEHIKASEAHRREEHRELAGNAVTGRKLSGVFMVDDLSESAELSQREEAWDSLRKTPTPDELAELAQEVSNEPTEPASRDTMPIVKRKKGNK